MIAKPAFDFNSDFASGRRWQLKPFVQIEAAGDDVLRVVWLGNETHFRSAVARKLAPVLRLWRQPLSLTELRAHLDPSWPEKTLRQAMVALVENGFLDSPQADAAVPAFADFSWSAFVRLFSGAGTSHEIAVTEVARTRAVLASNLPVPPSFEADFGGGRVDVDQLNVEAGKDEIYVLVLTAEISLLQDIAARLRLTGASVLLILIDPFGCMIGPLLGAPGSPCLDCVAKRLEQTCDEGDGRLVARAWPLIFWTRLSTLIQQELLQYQTFPWRAGTLRGVHVFDFLNHKSEFEEIFPVPGCICNHNREWPSILGELS